MSLHKYIASNNATRQFFKRRVRKSANAKINIKDNKYAVQKILQNEFEFQFDVKSKLFGSSQSSSISSSNSS